MQPLVAAIICTTLAGMNLGGMGSPSMGARYISGAGAGFLAALAIMSFITYAHSL